MANAFFHRAVLCHRMPKKTIWIVIKPPTPRAAQDLTEGWVMPKRVKLRSSKYVSDV